MKRWRTLLRAVTLCCWIGAATLIVYITFWRFDHPELTDTQRLIVQWQLYAVTLILAIGGLIGSEVGGKE